MSVDGMDFMVEWSLDGFSLVLCSIFIPAFPSDISWVKNFKMGEWPHPSTGTHVYLLEMISSGSISLLLDTVGNFGKCHPHWVLGASHIPSI